MGLFGRSKLAAGLDIGSGIVKLVVIDHSKPEPEIVQVATSPLVPDAIVEGEIMDPALVAETVRSLVESAGLRKKDVVAAVGGHDVIVKKIPMDRMSASDAGEVIRWEAEQHVPFDMENVQLDFQILDPDEDTPQMAVLLVAAKRELIENRMSLLTDAGLNPGVIDVEAFALHNAFSRSYPGVRDGLVALVNIGHETTNVNLMADGAPVLVRDVPFGTRRLRESLQRERGMTATARRTCSTAARTGRAALSPR
jgi:type IV pilus assembly protein PilM